MLSWCMKQAFDLYDQNADMEKKFFPKDLMYKTKTWYKN